MFFELSKLFWMLAMPVNALILLMLVGLGVSYWRPRLGQRIFLSGAGLLLILAIVPVGPAMLWGLEHTTHRPSPMPKSIDGVIVLGGMFDEFQRGERGVLNANDNIDRMFCFYDLAKKYPKAKLVFSGGSGDILHPEAKESSSAELYLQSLKINPKRIMFERDSRNTYENAVLSKDKVKPKDGDLWILITSAYHMPRSMAVFEKAGWDVMPYPCDERTGPSFWSIFYEFNALWNLQMLSLATREWIGLIVYRLSGKSAFIFVSSSLPSGA